MVMGSAAPQDEIKQDMTPMIYVVFQLMIFFMSTIKFKTMEGKLSAYLPKDVGVDPTPCVLSDFDYRVHRPSKESRILERRASDS